MFKAFSDSAIGDGEKLYSSLLKTTPINPENSVEVNLQLPLYIPNYYYSLVGSKNYGRSSCNYETGTVAWFIMAALEELMGAKATVCGIKLSPVLPDEWDNVSVTRKFKDATYSITYKKGEKSTVNGIPFDGEYLPYEKGKHYDVIFGI